MSDPLVHHGRHFGRTVHAMCSVQALITNGILRIGQDELEEVSDESLTAEFVLSFRPNIRLIFTFFTGLEVSTKCFRNCCG